MYSICKAMIICGKDFWEAFHQSFLSNSWSHFTTNCSFGNYQQLHILFFEENQSWALRALFLVNSICILFAQLSHTTCMIQGPKFFKRERERGFLNVIPALSMAISDLRPNYTRLANLFTQIWWLRSPTHCWVPYIWLDQVKFYYFFCSFFRNMQLLSLVEVLWNNNPIPNSAQRGRKKETLYQNVVAWIVQHDESSMMKHPAGCSLLGQGSSPRMPTVQIVCADRSSPLLSRV